MYARNVSLRIKAGKLNEFNRALDKDVLPLLRRQAGFREEIILAMPGDVEITAISLWDSKEQADAYSASAYPRVLQAVNALLDGSPKVQTSQVIQSTLQQAEAARAVRELRAMRELLQAMREVPVLPGRGVDGRCPPRARARRSRRTRRSRGGSWRIAGTRAIRGRCAS